MAVSFSRTTRALDADRGLAAVVVLTGAAMLLIAWAGWFCLGRVTVYEVSREARIEVTSAARTVAVEQGGRLVATGLYIGRRVHAGEVLAEFDAAPQKLRLAEAEARLAGFAARAAALERALGSARQAQGDAAQAANAATAIARTQTRAAQAEAAFASAQSERAQRDSAAGGLAPVDAARATLEARKTAAARDAAALAEGRTAGDARSSAAGRAVAAAQTAAELAGVTSDWSAAAAQVQQLRRDLELRRVRAPVDGVIGDVGGQRLGDVIAAGTRLATIVPAGNLRIVAAFDAASGLGRLAQGQDARLRLSGFAWTEYGEVPARVERVGAEPNGGLLRVELRLIPREDSELPLRHGMPGQVDVAVEAVAPVVLMLRTLGRVLA